MYPVRNHAYRYYQYILVLLLSSQTAALNQSENENKSNGPRRDNSLIKLKVNHKFYIL